MNKTPMTVAGAQKLREELQYLKAVERPRIIRAIAEARAHGDLSENAEYHAAREQQGFVEGRIKEIENKLATAEIIDVTVIEARARWCSARLSRSPTSRPARASSTASSGRTRPTYRRASYRSDRRSRALINKEEGDIALVDAPGGRIEFEIVAIRYE